MTLFINIILGFPLLIWGRKLFWLFVGSVGFIARYWLGQGYLTIKEDWMLVLLGAALGVVGVLLALLVQKTAVAVTGFIAGVYLAINAVMTFHINAGPWNWFIYSLGGMMGTFLVIVMFDLALIILSSLIGAALISQSVFQLIQIDLLPRSIVFIILLLIGLIAQYEQKTSDV